MSTGSQIGFASRLRRHGAVLANHADYGRDEFIAALADFHQNLGIEGRAADPDQRQNSEERGDNTGEAYIDWATLHCPKCRMSAENTRKLVDHIVDKHCKPMAKFNYLDMNVVEPDVKKLVDEAVEMQASCSYVKRKFANSNDLLVCSIDSPLIPFIMMRNLELYLGQMPPTVSGISITVVVGDVPYTIFFSFHKVDQWRKKVRRAATKKERNRRLKELEKRCSRAWVAENDLAHKKRNNEENKALAQALRLPANCSGREIARKLDEMRERHEEMSNVYANTIKANGQKMTVEEKKLISSLKHEFMAPVSGKRKTTFKNPSETMKKNKKRKVAEAN